MAKRQHAAVLALAALLTACGTVVPGNPVAARPSDSDRQLIRRYFDDSRAAADQGAQAQREFLDRTQHPDFRSNRCELGELTLLFEPTLSTLRQDPQWSPPGSGAGPRGTVYIVAVTVTARREDTTVASQIGSQHIVVLDGTAYGFAPCP